MMNCEKISQLVSRDLDEPLPWRQRVTLRLHLAMCKLCRQFAKQLHLIRRFSRAAGEMGPQSLTAEGTVIDASLSPEAKARIKSSLENP